MLSHMRNNPLARKNGIILIACGDCDKSDELIEYERSLFLKSEKQPRIHLLMLNGGALLLHPDSPLNTNLSSSQTLLFHLKNSSQLKGIDDVVLYGHHECGAAALSRLQPRETFLWLAKGAGYVSNMIKTLKITCNFHYECNTDKKFKSEYFDYNAWLKLHQSVTASDAAKA